MDYQFRINLRGIIDLLSNHLYSGPEVYLRELLQNGIDALHARTLLEPGHRGQIEIEVHPGRNGSPPTLSFLDSGVGLTEEEIHRFLATIGQSSKSGEFWERPDDFIGRFGIGLLSCFVVSDEIVVITRSSRSADAPTMEWRGRPDGTYTIKTLGYSVEPGTQVFLTCKPGSEEAFEADYVRQQAAHFGGLLPMPVRLRAGGGEELINAGGIPWRQDYGSEEERREALLEWGRRAFGVDFIDFIPLHSDVGRVDGLAFVLPFSPSLATKRTHRVYLKHMLLSEKAENILPEWAFFVKCVVNAHDLRPMASRESFYEDDRLAKTRAALGDCLREYLVRLARSEPERLQKIVRLHDLSIKALAIRDRDFYRLFIDHLQFETSVGQMSFGEYRRKNPVVRYVPTVDQFRQIAPVAGAQGMAILNAGYVYEAELMGLYEEAFPKGRIERVDPAGLTAQFAEIDPAEQPRSARLLGAATELLAEYDCVAELRTFKPRELPALYIVGAEAEYRRTIEQAREQTSGLWGELLGDLAGPLGDEARTRLCLNYANPLVRKLATVRDRTLLRRSLEMLYVQALLMGRRPLDAREMKLLNTGLLGLIEYGLGRPEDDHE